MALGIVLTPYGKLPNGNPPYGITYAYGGDGTYLTPDDPQHYTRGEAGYYPDTALGAPRLGFFSKLKRSLGLGRNPTDFEIGRGNYPFLPFYSGWINTNQGYVTGPWLPPNGWSPDGVPQAIAPLQTQQVPLDHGYLAGLREGALPATTEDVIAIMNAHNDRVFALTVVSTTAVAVSALVTLFRTLKLIKEDK